MSQEILFDVKADRQNQWYGTLAVSNIHSKGQSPHVKKFLGLIFKSPADVADGDFWYSVSPWVEIKQHISSHQIDASTYLVTVKLEFPSSYTFNSKEIFTFGINGDLTSDPDPYSKSFILDADRIPAGTVDIHCADAPSQKLVGYKQEVTFTLGSSVIPESVTPGKTTSVHLPPSTYIVNAAELADQNQTVIATPHISSETITVVNNKVTSLNVTYSKVDEYSAIDVTVGHISPLEKEHLHVTVVRAGHTLSHFWSPADHTTPLRRLPASGTIDVGIDPISLNNVRYLFNPQKVDVSASLYHVKFLKADHKEHIPTIGFVEVVIRVTTDLILDANITVRLVGSSAANLNYTQDVKAKAGNTKFAALVSPGHYTVKASSFIQDGTVYVIQAPTTVTITTAGGNLFLTIKRGANLKVPGFPNFLSFGGITDLTSGNEADFVKARASSIFKYAGVDGAGDAGGYLTADTATVRTVELAHNVGQKLGKPVVPVMISYTINLSGGNWDNLENPTQLAHSFGNLILSLNEANKTIQTKPVDAVGYIVNADFLGACQQEKKSPDLHVHVRKPLQDALDHWKVAAEIPDSITETLRGYVLAVNWLIRTIAKDFTFTVTFGWQVNLWGVGSSQWIYSTEDPAKIAQQTAAYANELNVFDSTYHPDFLAVDRYEADDFTYRAYGNGYCFGPREWPRFFDFCKALSMSLQIPVMPWQIPSSHTPLVSDPVADDPDSQHWGTGGSYILGDPGVGSDYHHINPKVLALEPRSIPSVKTVKDLFVQGEPFDWTDPAYTDFPLRGIFAVLLGGGATTGIISSVGNAGPWVLDKLHAYMEKPIPL